MQYAERTILALRQIVKVACWKNVELMDLTMRIVSLDNSPAGVGSAKKQPVLIGNKGLRAARSPILLRSVFLYICCLEILSELLNPRGRLAPFYDQFSIGILGDLDEAIIVIEEVRLVTIRQNIRHNLPAAGKTPQHIFPACIMPTMGNTVLNTLQALLDAVKANIEKPTEYPRSCDSFAVSSVLLFESVVSCAKLIPLFRHALIRSKAILPP